MERTDLYQDAHLVAAAIRVLEHQNGAPPAIEEISQALSFSAERCHHLCKKLKALGIIDMLEAGYGMRLCIGDHLRIEDIPKETCESAIEKEVKKFHDERKEFSKKIESLQADQKEKKKNLFAEIEEKLKKDLKKE
jgi:DNA-binding Lrp family transcriptional regulator